MNPEFRQRNYFRWLSPTNWKFWAVLTLLLPGGASFLALSTLLQLQKLPNCPSIHWPTASASLRLYCSDLAASKQTVEDLLEAIALVNELPTNHLMRPEIDRSIERWATDILDIAEEVFDEGKFEEAKSLARKVPANTTAHQLVSDRVTRWETIWERAEEVSRTVEDLMRQEQWRKAFETAVKLLDVGNRYWETTKYAEVSELIQQGRIDSQTLSEARRLSDAGGWENLLAAIELAETIGSDSYLHGEAQMLIPKFGRQMLALAESQLEDRNLEGAIAIANQIPASAELTKQTRDFLVLANAQAQAWRGTVSSLEAAILQAQQVDVRRPMYGRAQRLISRWQREIEDVARLEKARQLAGLGTLKHLAEAAAEASLIPVNNPRYREAQTNIASWRREIQIIEDTPYLNRAETLARSGDLGSLQAAIAEARLIGRGRFLYREAQQKISQWNSDIELIQDRPYLDNARRLARSGNAVSLRAAIDEARRVNSGRLLYREAQQEIRDWTIELERIQDRPYLDRAERLAIAGDPASLQAAIDEARRISRGRVLYQEARDKIEQWTGKLQRIEDGPSLNRARELASRGDLRGAIDVAERIQPDRALYSEASAEIRGWRTQLRATDSLTEARQIAGAATPAALAAAIRTAERVPTGSRLRTEAEWAIARWSQQILNLARERSGYDLQGAIAIAKQVPSNTAAYSQAIAQIEAWEKLLAPSTEQLPPLPTLDY